MTSNLFSRYLTIAIVLGLAGVCISLNWPISLGIDLRGGSILTYRVEKLTAGGADLDGGGAITEEDVDDVVTVIAQRINKEGVKDIQVRREGGEMVRIVLPDFTKEETEVIRERMTQVGQLLMPIAAADRDSAYGGTPFNKDRFDAQRKAAIEAGRPYKAPDGFEWFPNRPEREEKQSKTDYEASLAEYERKRREAPLEVGGTWMYFDERWWNPELDVVGFTGRDIFEPRRSFDSKGTRAVAYKVREARQVYFAEYTETFIGRQMALVLNGEIWSSASIEGRLSDNVQIHKGGGYSEKEQKWLLNCLQAGSLKLRPVLMSQEEVSATLGQTAINRGQMAFIAGAVLVIVFMMVYYRFSGVLAVIALTTNFVLVFAVLMLLDSSLTLPGIAGLVLTVGMAVDANILIFERIREELKKGKKLVHAAKNGFDRAFVTIFDANLTTFIVAAFLVAYGKGPIKGFGYTLMTGIACSMFAALYITRTLMGTAIARGWISEMSMMQIVKKTSFDFIGKAKNALTVSVIVLIAGLAVFFTTGEEKYGLDFTGGTSVRMQFTEPLSEGEVKSQVAKITGDDGSSKYRYVDVTLVDASGTESRDIDLQLDYQPVTLSDEEAENAEGLDEFKKIQEELQGILGDRLVPVALTDEQYDKTNGLWSATLNLSGAQTDNSEIMAVLTDARLANPAVAAIGNDGRSWKISGTELDQKLVEQRKSDIYAAMRAHPSIKVSNPFPNVRFVGPNVVADLKESAIKAMIVSLMFILAYIWFRFKELKYGLAATVALVHDVLIALGLTVLFNNTLGLVNVPISLNVIAAFLTIIGYSLNDTIVVFDRIRENLGSTKGSFGDVVNRSINQTLSRTILTSMTTFAVIMAVFATNLGLESPLEGLSFTLLIGVVVGTYSSIFVASPVLIWAHNRDLARKAAKEAASKGRPATV